MREDITLEGALVAKHQEATKSEWKNKKKESSTSAELATGKVKDGQKKSYPLYQNCNKKGYPPFKCWRRLDAKCSNCQQMGGMKLLFAGMKGNKNEEEANTVDQEEEDYLFVATCFTSMSSTNRRLINNGCSNYMTDNKSLFKEWCEITSSMVRVGDGNKIAVKEKCTIVIPTCHGTKLITNVLYVLNID